MARERSSCSGRPIRPSLFTTVMENFKRAGATACSRRHTASISIVRGSSGLRIGPITWSTSLRSMGKQLMALGKKGVAGDNNSMDLFNGASDIAIAPNGDFFVSDGQGGNSRVVKFSKDGKFIKAWGTKGSEHGQFDVPHALATDSKWRLLVVDEQPKAKKPRI